MPWISQVSRCDTGSLPASRAGDPLQGAVESCKLLSSHRALC